VAMAVVCIRGVAATKRMFTSDGGLKRMRETKARNRNYHGMRQMEQIWSIAMMAQ